MQAYTEFARVYDEFMDNVPYDEWTEYLTGLLREYGVMDGLVLELGCGTGNITRRLADKGYDMIGIDNSGDMLEIGREREYEYPEGVLKEAGVAFAEEEFDESETASNGRILYLQQDMRELELYGTVAGAVSLCDSMNYITSEEELLRVFRLVNNYLDARGMFIFDMNTEYKYEYILSNNIIAENREDCSFIWENYYDSETMLNEYELTIFVKQQEEEAEGFVQEQASHPFFRRFKEIHYQKAYKIDTVKKLLEEAGMEFIGVYDALTHNPPPETSERVYYIAREKQQEGKTYR